MRGVCACGTLLDLRFGDGDEECVACRENRAEGNLLPAVEVPEVWRPVAGRIGGVGFGEGRKT